MNALILGIISVLVIVAGFFGYSQLSPNAPYFFQDGEEQSEELFKGAVLDLGGRGLTSVSQDTFTQNNIIELDLSDNALTGSLPAEVRHLKNLIVLDLSGNQFTGVPAEVGQLSELEVLDLSYNRLTGLPYELGNLSHLKILDLRGNDYAEADLAIIREKLPTNVEIRVD
ncbi:MAG: leucine-rich repeat domain-containing protein [Patescibacteria group bacterium]